jgi:hypothetical protein
VASRKAAAKAARPDADLAGLPGGGGPVGRDDVLAQLRFAAEEAVTGRGELILLTGEAGIGKTTMLSEAARYAETRGIRVAWGFCGPDDSAPAYWPGSARPAAAKPASSRPWPPTRRPPRSSSAP